MCAPYKASLPPVADWMLMSQCDVLDRFASLPDAVTAGEGQRRFVFVPGRRADRVLLVAHSDTVWEEEPIRLACLDDRKFGPILHSAEFGRQDGLGIGADDRAGCAILWELRNLGHSLLVTSGEEQGCIATLWIMTSEWWETELNSHRFAVQFDRRGRSDTCLPSLKPGPSGVR